MKLRTLLVGALVFVILLLAFLVEPIAQDPGYFAFSDQSTHFGIANALNVLSNLPFLIIGTFGLNTVLRYPQTALHDTKNAWIVLFVGVILTGFGSAYFHWQPTIDTLVWDRLPMTIAFMSLTAIAISEFIDPNIGKRCLLPLLVVGAISVAYWVASESRGAGDLRPYALVPLVLIPVLMRLHRGSSDLAIYLWATLALYIAAKVAEFFDTAIFSALGGVSGHTLKHLLAALAVSSLVYALTQRKVGQYTY